MILIPLKLYPKEFSFDFVFALHSSILFTMVLMYLTTLPSNVLPFLPLPPFVVLLRQNGQLCGFYFRFRVQINGYRTRVLVGAQPPNGRNSTQIVYMVCSSLSSSPVPGQRPRSIHRRRTQMSRGPVWHLQRHAEDARLLTLHLTGPPLEGR